ncbi:putative bifunctional diguanylate cyclase/phosphodiesterase [Viridibacterium curvum]|uniref:EAL domain-containing protein n=1 Tax=Viridibacterium curvum TaxID=1101404 RepID=A0ABP9QBG6_9RHOO
MSHPIIAVDNWLSNQAMARKLRVLIALGVALLVVLSSVLLAGAARWWQGRSASRALTALQVDLDAEVRLAASGLARRLESVRRDAELVHSLAGDAPAQDLKRVLDRLDSADDIIIVAQDDHGTPLAARGVVVRSGLQALQLGWLGAQGQWVRLGERPMLAVRAPIFQDSPGQRVKVGYVALMLPQLPGQIERLAARQGFAARWLGGDADPAPMADDLRMALWRSDAPVLGEQAFDEGDTQRGVLQKFGSGDEVLSGAILNLPTGSGPVPMRLLLQQNAGWLQDGHAFVIAALLALVTACLLVAVPVSGLARRYFVQPFERLGDALRGDHSVQPTSSPTAGSPHSEFDRLRDMANVLSRENRELRHDSALWSSVFRHAREAICVTDPQGRIEIANSTFLSLCGLGEAETLGQIPGFLVGGTEDATQAEEIWIALRKQGEWNGEVRHVRIGEEFPVCAVSIFAIRDEQGAVQHLAAFFSDNTGHREQEARIQYLAHHDTLTGLPNRARFMERLRTAVQTAERGGRMVALLFIDLDRFKVINDTLGHAVGDELLRTVADRLVRTCESGEVVARSGGDEFVIMLDRLREPADAQRAAEHILAIMAPTARVSGHELAITPSIGIAVYPEHGIDAEELVRNADVAMYYAKSQGRNNCQLFSPRMAELAEESLSLEHALRTAADRDEFILYYQPQIEMATRKLVGVEALIRWNSQQFGMVSPAKFIRIAEECGLILQMGDWVLREACRQRAEWNLAGVADFPIAVNVSALQFRQPEFIRRVEEALQIYGISTTQLELELTESIVMHESGATAAALRRLRDMGVALSIDDFGTGYSSLGYLKHLPIQKLKVDGAFVRGIESDKADRAIVEAIVSLGRALDLTLVAEGVEQRSTITVLSKLGCHVAQGYYYCRPLPAEEFVSWFSQFNGEGKRQFQSATVTPEAH